jgi:hypothetical protein
MKLFWFFFVLMLSFSSLTHGQSDQVSQRVYVGVLSNGNFYESAEFEGSANLLVGAKTDFVLVPDYITFVGRNAYGTSGSVNHFFLVCKPDELYDVSFGFIPRPTALLRPDPVSAKGQLELPSGNVIPGAAPGAIASIRLDTSGTKFMLGSYLTGKKMEFDAGFSAKIDSLELGVGILRDTNRTALDILVKNGKTSVLIFSDFDNFSSLHVELPFYYDFLLYGDGTFDMKLNKSTEWEFGFTKEFEAKTSCVVGFGCRNNKGISLRAFVLLYI